MNILLKTENLVGLEYLIKQKGLAGKIDLIYTDPPFCYQWKFYDYQWASNYDKQLPAWRSSIF